jgi:hypothetical protein
MSYSKLSPILSSVVPSWVVLEVCSFEVQSFLVGWFQAGSFKVGSFKVKAFEVRSLEVQSANRILESLNCNGRREWRTASLPRKMEEV